uniref:Uncharacterized protein n=1 Tax=Rhizophora mucronata TaxID=61149 RepID=A0A2P2L039_RHIMU
MQLRKRSKKLLNKLKISPRI